jgi:hypothetical protein
MSKSLGNLVFVGDLCKGVGSRIGPARPARLPLPGDWDWRTNEDMPAATARLALWRSAPDDAAPSGAEASPGLTTVRAAFGGDVRAPVADGVRISL